MRSMRILTALAFVLSFATLATAKPTEVSGAAILEHPIGKLAVKNMGLCHAGKIEEAVALGSKSMQAEWKAMSAEDRKMLGEMMKEFSHPPDKFSADIKKFGKLSIDGDKATLTVSQEIKEATGTSTSTISQSYLREGGEWRVTQ